MEKFNNLIQELQEKNIYAHVSSIRLPNTMKRTLLITIDCDSTQKIDERDLSYKIYQIVEKHYPSLKEDQDTTVMMSFQYRLNR